MRPWMTECLGTAAQWVESGLATSRLARDGPGWLRRPTSLEQALESTRRAMRRRAENFLDVARRLIYANRSSPYLALLRHVGCELGDLERLVATEGLEGALARLAARGVYVTDQEMKGRTPIRRGSLTLTPSDRHFRNPRAAGHLVVYSGGSGGLPTGSPRSLAHEALIADLQAVVGHAHRLGNHQTAVWSMSLGPAALYMAKAGRPIRQWFYPIARLPLAARLQHVAWRQIFGRAGVRIPTPRYADVRDPRALARWMIEAATRGAPTLLICTSSMAVRLSVAARSEGLSLEGTVLMTRSEPMTEARLAEIERAGARAIATYGANDITHVAMGCANGTAADDAHLVSSLYAMATRRRTIMDGDDEVDALLFTTLSLDSCKVGLNVELGDFADVEERPRDCCGLGEVGFTTHLSNIRSFEKLTGEGVSVARSAIVRVIERDLPLRFGGSSVDYQLIERQGTGGLTRLILSIDPRVGTVDEALVRAELLGFLRRGDMVDRYSAALWERAESIAVERAVPRATRAGKVLPFFYDRTS